MEMFLKKPEKEIDFSFMHKVMEDFSKAHMKRHNDIMKQAFSAHGIDINDLEFIKKNVSRIQKEGEKFEHYFIFYGTDKQERIISIEIQPDIEYLGNDPFKVSSTTHYY